VYCICDVFRQQAVAVRLTGPLSTSLHSVTSTPSHTEHTDAAVSFTNSSPSISSLTPSHTSQYNYVPPSTTIQLYNKLYKLTILQSLVVKLLMSVAFVGTIFISHREQIYGLTQNGYSCHVRSVCPSVFRCWLLMQKT